MEANTPIYVTGTELARLRGCDIRTLRTPAVTARLLAGTRITRLYNYPTELTSAAVVVNSNAAAKIY